LAEIKVPENLTVYYDMLCKYDNYYYKLLCIISPLL